MRIVGDGHSDVLLHIWKCSLELESDVAYAKLSTLTLSGGLCWEPDELFLW
jgi:hypothetical protein